MADQEKPEFTINLGLKQAVDYGEGHHGFIDAFAAVYDPSPARNQYVLVGSFRSKTREDVEIDFDDELHTSSRKKAIELAARKVALMMKVATSMGGVSGKDYEASGFIDETELGKFKDCLEKRLAEKGF